MDRRPLWTLIATSTGLGMALLDVTAGNVAVPSIQVDLRTGIDGLSWVIDAYTLSFASLLLLAGGLGDRLGARRVFGAGLVTFTVASVLCGLAPTVSMVIAARVLQGIGAALFMPASLALLARAYPDPRRRAQAIGLWSALTAIAGGSGPLVGGLLVSTIGWRSIFLVNVPIGVLGVFLTARFVAPTPPAGARHLDLPAQLVAALSLASITWALVERGEHGWISAPVLGAFVTGLAGLLLFVRLERTGAHPMLPRSLFRNRTFSSTAAGALLYAAAFFGGLLVLSLYFQRVRGESAALTGLQITLITATFCVTSVFAGRLAGRHGPQRPILIGLALLAGAALVLSFVGAAAPLLVIGPPLVLLGLGAGLVAPPMNAAILASVEPSRAGIGSGVLNASRQVGTALGVAVFASLFHGGSAELGSVHLAMASAAGLYLAAFAVVALAPGPAGVRAAALDGAVAPGH